MNAIFVICVAWAIVCTQKITASGSCSNDHVATLGTEQLFQSTKTCGRSTFRSKSGERLRVWFNRVSVPKGRKVTVTLKDQIDRDKWDWKLLHNNTDRNFDVQNDDDWFQIQESAYVWFNLSYMSYSSNKCPYYEISENDEASYVSPGYPENLPNKECEFYFTASNTDRTKKIYLRFTDLLLSPGDEITVQDTKNGETLATFSERNVPPVHVTSKGHSVRLFFRPTGTSKSRFTLFHQASDKCIKEYYSYDYSDNNAQKISFAKSKCLHIIKSNKASWLRVWFNTTGAKNEPLVNLDVILKDLWGKQRRQWNLIYENVRNFIAEEKGDWFEIEEPESGSNRWFHLKFKLYSADKNPYYKASEEDKSGFVSLNFPASDNCEIYFKAKKSTSVIHLRLSDFLSPEDAIDVYDPYTNEFQIRYRGTDKLLKSVTSKSDSARVVFVQGGSQDATRIRFEIVHRALPQDKCMNDYLGSLGTKHRIRVAQRPCLHVVRSHKDTWLRLWFEPITSNDGNVSITLKDSRGKERIKWNLKPGDSKHMRNFGAVDKGDRFEIEEQSLLAHNKFDLSFMLYSADQNPYYKESEEYESGFVSPGYPVNFLPDKTCEIYIKAKKKTQVIHLRSSELFLFSKDNVTFYDPYTGEVLKSYNNETDDLLVSVTSKNDSVRVVFISTDKISDASKRRFGLMYKSLPPDKCLIEYQGKSGEFPSVDRSCEFNIYYSEAIQLTFSDIHVSPNSVINISQGMKRDEDSFTSLGNISSDHSGDVVHFRNILHTSYDVITFRTHSKNSTFRLFFKPYQSKGSKTLNGTNGTLYSPNYPGSYLRDFKMTYTVIVPRGHVVLNFTELKLFGRVNFGDEVSVFDGSSTSEDDRLNTLTGDSKTENKWFVGSANKLTVVFYASKDNVPQKIYRFRAEYYMKENVKRCVKPIWPNTKSERDSTLPGRKTSYHCKANYSDAKYENRPIWRVCDFDGEWEKHRYVDGEREPVRKLDCKKTCLRLDEKLRKNSTLYWEYPDDVHPKFLLEGMFAKFHCRGDKMEVNGPKAIWCTEHGNYSAAPPTCHIPPSQTWKYILGFGVLLLMIIMTMVILRDFLGCFPSLDSVKSVFIRIFNFCKRCIT